VCVCTYRRPSESSGSRGARLTALTLGEEKVRVSQVRGVLKVGDKHHMSVGQFSLLYTFNFYLSFMLYCFGARYVPGTI
jgi:hypothetical protein